MTIISPTDPRIKATAAFGNPEINVPTYELARFTDKVMSADDVAEILVVSTYSDVQEKGWLLKWDRQLDGLISKSLKKHEFSASLGESLLVDATKQLKAPAKKYILVVGMGAVTSQKSSMNCGLFKLALETAEKVGAERLVLPFFPDRGSLSALAVCGSIAILRCRIGESALQSKIKSLKSVKLLVSGQAANTALRSLSSHREAFCQPCPQPSLVKEEDNSTK